jgi:hypothetical protein
MISGCDGELLQRSIIAALAIGAVARTADLILIPDHDLVGVVNGFAMATAAEKPKIDGKGDDDACQSIRDLIVDALVEVIGD